MRLLAPDTRSRGRERRARRLAAALAVPLFASLFHLLAVPPRWSKDESPELASPPSAPADAYAADVPLRLIGAGLPRTGTSSLREALRHLLNAPIYHMSEAFAHPEHAPTWVAAIEGHTPMWDDFLAGYAAGVDAPFSTCWRHLAAAYPDAPVLLSHRGSAKVWQRSMAATVLPRTREILARDDDDPMVPLFRVIFADLFTDADDPANVIAGYERWLAEVRAEIAPERLIEWQPGDGWEPICHALAPDLPFPHENSTTDYVARAARRARADDRRLLPGTQRRN